jgi:hypothetical protein
MLRATGPCQRPCQAAQGGHKRAAVAGAALAGAAGVLGLGVGAAYARHAMQQVMSAPPQNLEAMYTDLERSGGDSGGSNAQGAQGVPEDPTARKGLDCAKVLGAQAFLHKGDVFFTCLRHMLYSSRPLYAHCKDATWRDAGVLADVQSIVGKLDPKPKAKTLSWLSVLLRLRCAREFRKKLRMYIREAVVSGVKKDMMKAEPEQHVVSGVKKDMMKAEPEQHAPDRQASAQTQESTDTHDREDVFGRIASVLTKGAAEFQSAFDERAKKVRAGLAFDPIVYQRHQEVAMCATGVDRGSEEAKWVRDNAATHLQTFFEGGPNVTDMMKVARMYGALFVSPSATLKYMPPLPAQARGLPDSASRAESILLTWIGRRLSSDIDLDAAWKVRDLLIATMRVQYVGYEPEWWGWQFARCVHDYAEHGTKAALDCVLELVTELQADPYSTDGPERQKPRAANAPRAKRASQYKGAYSEVYDAALLGDEDAKTLILKGLEGQKEKAELERHAKSVVKEIGSAGGDLGAWREYEFCVALLAEWKVPFEKPSVKTTLVSAFYQKETGELGKLAKEAVKGTYEQIDALRRILDPEQSTLVPIPKAALRMLRGFIKTSETFEKGPLKVFTDVIQKHSDVDITADVSTAKMISEADTHREVKPKEYVLLRRVEELLFAMRQVEMLAEQLFPRTATWTTDGYMRRLAYGVRVDGTNYVPMKKDGTWTIGDKTCVHVRDNVVKIGGKDEKVSTPSYAQWVNGVKVARKLAELAIDAWAPA